MEGVWVVRGTRVSQKNDHSSMSKILTSIPLLHLQHLPLFIACFDHNVLITGKLLKFKNFAGCWGIGTTKKGPNGEVSGVTLCFLRLFLTPPKIQGETERVELFKDLHRVLKNPPPFKKPRPPFEEAAPLLFPLLNTAS